MYYEINVTHNGKHFFATAERSLTGVDNLIQVHQVMVRKFPSSEGYEVTVTRHENVAWSMDPEDLRS